MEGEGMVAVVRGLREEGLAVTLLHGNRQYTLLPNSSSSQRPPMNIVNASTQQCIPKLTVDTSTEPSAPQPAQCDRDAQAIDGRYASTYKTMHCNVRPTSPPVHLTEFPPQRPDHCPGHGNFIVGGSGSGATASPIKANSASPNFRGGLSWPDRGSVCSPRPSHEVDAFVNSLRRYPCLSPDRSSEVMERLVNYTQAKGITRFTRNLSSPTRLPEPSSYNALESKSTNTRTSRPYEPDVCIRARKPDESPTRERKRDEHDMRPVRCYDVRCVRDMSKRMRENVKAYTSYPYNHPVCPPTIVENNDCHTMPCDYQNSSNSVNMEVQAAVRMLSKEVATTPREHITRKTVAVPESPVPSAGEEYVEGECYFVENLDITTSIKSIQTSSCPSDTTLKPRKSAQTVLSTIDFHSTQNRTVVSRKTKSQEQIKLTKEELKITLLELINEITDSGSKNTIREELIKKLFVTSDSKEKDDQRPYEDNRVKFKHDNCHNYAPNACPPVYDYVGDYQDLVGKLKHCYGDSNHVVRSEISPFRISEYRQLDFVLKDWINNLNLKDSDRYMDKTEVLNYVEDCIKELLKNWTAQDFDLKSEIVNILQEIPIEINKRYNIRSYLCKLVDVLLKRMRNVIVSPQTGRVRRKPFANRPRKILTEKDIRDFLRAHLMDFFNEYDTMVCDEVFGDLENEMVDLTMNSIDCIRCGHIDDFMDEMDSMLRDIGRMTENEANYVSNIILQDLQEMLNSGHFNQTYMILNVSNNSGQYMNTTNSTDFSIGSITEEDLNANLDRYTNELCVQINKWLDTLNIPRIKDSGFREVVVNDLAGDIVDRHKYVDLNHTNKDTAQDQLEALKYQIFKWINKLVGDENQETIGHAENLLQMINSVPVPMLVIPKNRNMNNTGPFCEIDPNASRDGQTSPAPYSRSDQEIQGYTAQEINQPRQCCEADIGPISGKDTSKRYSNTAQEIQEHPEFLPVADRTGNVSYSQGHQTANAYSQGQGTPRQREAPVNSSSRSYGPYSPDNPWGSNTYSSVFEPPVLDNISQVCPGKTCGSMDPNQQFMYDPNDGAPQNRSGGSAPLSTSIKKLNEDYDEYLKQWVKRIPITAKTPAEQQEAETARLIVYNEIWKGVTKMKLDPNIFSNNQYYCQDFFEKEIERLLLDLPQSQDLNAAKPALKAQLLQKTLAMNNLIKSTNAPASFKQQLIDNIENNLPERAPTEDEEDKQNEELEKQNLADFYILYMRYKDEDNVKATVHKKNFLKKLDEYLDKIKNNYNLVDMNKNVYANEVIDSFDKIPTPSVPAIKDEADDILLALEVENWISGIPQNPNTAAPLDKRRTRDAIVKKIQEIAGNISCCDHAFRAPLKAELPKHLEKLPIEEGTNIEYMIDELANRIKNLSTSVRRVSFQAPQNYEEFSRNMPVASSFQDMSEQGSSFLVIGGNIVKDPGPRRAPWMSDKPSVPEDEIEWLSMEQTRMSQVPQNIQSQQVYFPKQDQIHNARSYRGDGSAVRQNNSRRPESMHSHTYNPNESGQMHAARSYPGEKNFMRNTGPLTSIPREKVEWNSMEETQMKPNLRGWSEGHQSMRSPQRYIPNESGQIAASRSYPESAQEVPGQFPPNAPTHFDPNSQGPCCHNGQGQFTSNLQSGELCLNPPCCPNPACLKNQSAIGSGPFSEPAAPSPGPRGSYGQGSSNGRGNAVQTSPLPRGTYGQGSPGQYNQSFGPAENHIPQGASAAFPRQSLQGSNVQGAPVTYNQGVPRDPGGQHCTTCPNIGQSQGPTLNTNGQSFGPHARYGARSSLGQMPYHIPNGAQMSQEPWSNAPRYQQTGQASIYGVIEGSGQGYLNANQNASAEVQAGMHSPTLNQTSQSPGPISAASQVPDQAPRPHNLQKMASGGMGVLGTSQEPGPSCRTSSAPNTPAFGAQQAIRTEATQPGVHIPANNRCIHQIIGAQQPAATDRNGQAYCVPPAFLDRPMGFSTPCRPFPRNEPQRPRKKSREARQDAEGAAAQARLDMDDSDSDRERERCHCMRRRRRFRPQFDLNDCHDMEHHDCIPMVRYPCHY